MTCRKEEAKWVGERDASQIDGNGTHDVVLEDCEESRRVQAGEGVGRKLSDSFVGGEEEGDSSERLERADHSDGCQSPCGDGSVLSSELTDGGRKVDDCSGGKNEKSGDVLDKSRKRTEDHLHQALRWSHSRTEKRRW